MEEYLDNSLSHLERLRLEHLEQEKIVEQEKKKLDDIMQEMIFISSQLP
jgi:hypothetical protein